MENKVMIIEIYGKEIKKDNQKFISCSCKTKENADGTHEFVNVRFTKESGFNAVKGLQKVKFNLEDSNVKITKDGDKEYKTLYISKAVGVEYTDEEKQAMKEKQAKKVADLF